MGFKKRILTVDGEMLAVNVSRRRLTRSGARALRTTAKAIAAWERWEQYWAESAGGKGDSEIEIDPDQAIRMARHLTLKAKKELRRVGVTIDE